MKILLRQLDDKHYYVWMDAIYKNGHFEIKDKEWGGLTIYQSEILATKDDDRSEYVICNNCGAMIKNDPESIEAHFAASEKNRNCFICPSLRRNKIKMVNEEMTDNPDGTIKVVETYNADLRCGQVYWNSLSVNSEEVKRYCLYYRCRNRGVSPIEDVFTKYPNLFDKNITVDVLNAKKFVPDEGGMKNDHFEYDMKLRNTLKACVNKLGIVDHFIVKCRSYKYHAYYSAKYDKLFFSSARGNYTESLPDYMSEAKYNQVKAKISALYKEEESK